MMNAHQFHFPQEAATAGRAPRARTARGAGLVVLAPPLPRRAPQARTARGGVSLMEVLISIFVISIGLMGIAALIPVANYALLETSKADRSAACGQAAMRDIRVRGLADPLIWTPSGVPGPGATYVIDPLGPATNFGPIPRATLAMNDDLKTRIFYWHDDLLFDMREGTSLRPIGFAAHGNAPVPERSYSWFFTVTPTPAEGAGAPSFGWTGPRRFNVSVVVCHQRDFTQQPAPENLDLVLVTGTTSGAIISGMRVANRPDPGKPDLDPGQWVMLSGPAESGAVVGQWYRITAGSGNYFALEGPNWPSVGGPGKRPTQMTALPGVLGVYTTTIVMNNSPEWRR